MMDFLTLYNAAFDWQTQYMIPVMSFVRSNWIILLVIAIVIEEIKRYWDKTHLPTTTDKQ